MVGPPSHNRLGPLNTLRTMTTKRLFCTLSSLTMLCALALALTGAVAQAQPVTNAPAAAADAAAQAPAGPAPANIWLTFGLDRVKALQQRPFANIPLWQFVASLTYIFLAFYLSKYLDYFVRKRVRRWAQKTPTKLDDLLIDLVRGPVRIIALVILLHVGMRVYEWPEALARFLSIGLKIIIACSLTYVLLKTIDVLMGFWRERTTTPENEQFSRQLLPLIRKSLKVFVVTVAAVVTSQNVGLDVTGLIASLSIGGLALGLAAQDTLGNLFGAVAILMDKPFKVGDRIQLDAVDGVVESIGFRSTRVRNLDGHLVSIPNKTMGNATITNISLRPNIRTIMNIGITYDTPPEKVRRAATILEEVYRGHPMTHDVWISFDKFSDFSLNLLVIYWWKSTVYKDFLAGMQELNLQVKQRFNAEGIEFAFPTQTVYVKSDAEPAPPGAGSGR